jgi:hypothetical protein
MSTFNAAGYAQSQANGPAKADPGRKNARIKTIIDEYTLLADLAVNDTIESFKIPANSRVIGAHVGLPVSLGGTCSLDLGWKASEDDDVTEAADADGFIDGVDATSTAEQSMPPTRPGYHKLFEKAVQIEMTAKAVSSSATGETIHMRVDYTE